MKLTNPEKLILIMLSEIYEKLGVDGSSEIDPKFIKNAIYTDNTWGIDWEYSGLLTGSSDAEPAEVGEVVNYLDMWDFIESSYEELDAQQQKDVAEKVEARVKFRGFDGNNESEYMSIAKFLIVDLGRFQKFKGRENLNSHSPTIGIYRRMYLAFEPIRRTLTSGLMDVDQLVLVLKAAQRT